MMCGVQGEEEAVRQKEEEERLEAEERAREAKRPRHHELDLTTLGGDELDENDVVGLNSVFEAVCKTSHPKRVGDAPDFTYDDDKQEAGEVEKLRSQLGKLEVVARAKVTQDRIYSAAYHPEPTKDLIFFGGKLFASYIECRTFSKSNSACMISSRQTWPIGHMGCTCVGRRRAG